MSTVWVWLAAEVGRDTNAHDLRNALQAEGYTQHSKFEDLANVKTTLEVRLVAAPHVTVAMVGGLLAEVDRRVQGVQKWKCFASRSIWIDNPFLIIPFITATMGNYEYVVTSGKKETVEHYIAIFLILNVKHAVNLISMFVSSISCINVTSRSRFGKYLAEFIMLAEVLEHNRKHPIVIIVAFSWFCIFLGLAVWFGVTDESIISVAFFDFEIMFWLIMCCGRLVLALGADAMHIWTQFVNYTAQWRFDTTKPKDDEKDKADNEIPFLGQKKSRKCDGFKFCFNRFADIFFNLTGFCFALVVFAGSAGMSAAIGDDIWFFNWYFYLGAGLVFAMLEHLFVALVFPRT